MSTQVELEIAERLTDFLVNQYPDFISVDEVLPIQGIFEEALLGFTKNDLTTDSDTGPSGAQ